LDCLLHQVFYRAGKEKTGQAIPARQDRGLATIVISAVKAAVKKP